MKTERVKNSIYNSFANLAVNMSVTIFSFIVRTIFIRQLGEQYLGLDGLYTNILSLLSLAELGFSSAISFSLYEPLAKNNTKKISQLMYYFKNIYRKIAIIILVAGLCLLPFLGVIVKGYTVSGNIYIIYLLYLVSTASSYFISYTSILIEADQKSYKLAFIKLIFNVLTYGLQLVILLTTKNFILYLVTQFFLRFIEMVITNKYIKRKYQEINFNKTDMLDLKDRNDIKKNIKGIFFHKVGDYAVNGTDNILISSIINISATGIYANYLSITSIFRNLIGSVISSTTASFGNLNVLEDSSTKKNVFNLVNFLCCFSTGLILVGLYFCFNLFVSMWIGNKFLLSNLSIIVICINFYLNCIMLPITAVKNSAGLYYIDRHIPVIRAIINLVISIIFGKMFGIVGILLGTTISSILTVNVTKPYIIYKYVFKSSCIEYFMKIAKNIFVITLSIISASYIIQFFTINSALYKFLIYGFISVIIYIIFFIAIYYKSIEFNYFKNNLLNKFRKD